MNYKIQKVNPQVEQAQYIKGTEEGNYFLIVAESPKGVIAFRPLSTAVPKVGTTPSTVPTRVRVVPQTDNANLSALLTRFGFQRKNGGSTPVHYSQVTQNAQAVIADAKLAFQLAA